MFEFKYISNLLNDQIRREVGGGVQDGEHI